jgi:hypothetical protein
MVLKDKKKKKKPRRLTGKPSGRQRLPVFKTGMNRDIPMGGAGGSQNLLANLQASRQAQPSAQVIQTPDQFKLAQDIKAIRSEQADIAEEAAEQKKERKKRWDYGLTIAERDYERVARAARAAEEKAAAAAEKRQRNEDDSKKRAEAGQEEPAGKQQPDPMKGRGRKNKFGGEGKMGGAGHSGDVPPSAGEEE